jgi:ABC-type Fe3+/spermidine/putrescine transport system ATPase subunit
MSISDVLVVMDNGVVKQIGSPVEIYEQPNDTFVANFIGHINFFEGTVHKLSGNEMVFRTDHGDLVTEPPALQVSVGERLKAVVRPESIRIARQDHQVKAGRNIIEGYVANNMYIGATTRYTIVVGEQMIYVDEADPQYRGILSKGDKARLVLKDTLHLLPLHKG